MTTIIEISANEQGGHENQVVFGKILPPDGWAIIPESIGTAETLENFPFGEVVAEEVNGVMTVTSWIPGIIPEPAIDLLKQEKVAQTKEQLSTYLATHPLTWTDGNQYSVTFEKQQLLTSQLALYQTATQMGQPYTLEWNTTGEECSVWTYEDLASLGLAIGAYVKPFVSYQQQKEVEIMACETEEELNAIIVDYNSVHEEL